MLMRIFETFFYPVDIIDYVLRIKVLDLKNKSSKCALAKGKEYIVNLNSEDFICPSAFHALYPYLLLAMSGSRMAWGTDEDKKNFIPCPDCVGVIYSIARKAFK